MPRVPPLSQLRTANVLGLPRLTIPSLEQTTQRYGRGLLGLRPVAAAAAADSNIDASDADFMKAVDAHLATLTKFATTSGVKIQKELVERDRAAAATGQYPYSYIEPLWDDGYLAYDEPCPINVAAAFVSKPLDPNWSQAQVASKLARSCAKWFIAATEGNVMDRPPKGKETCVAGMPVQFGFCRKPGALRDSLYVVDTPERALRYVTVVCKGSMYLVSLVNQQGTLRSERSLGNAFTTILNMAKEQAPAQHPVPALSTGNRREWFKSRSAVRDIDAGNASNLRFIECSLCVICLDSVTSSSSSSSSTSAPVMSANDRVRNSLLGLGSDAYNRWYDKHQLIVTDVPGEGFGVLSEHAFSDGMAWCTWINAVYDDIVTGGKALPEPTGFMLVPLEALSAAAAQADGGAADGAAAAAASSARHFATPGATAPAAAAAAAAAAATAAGAASGDAKKAAPGSKAKKNHASATPPPVDVGELVPPTPSITVTAPPAVDPATPTTTTAAASADRTRLDEELAAAEEGEAIDEGDEDDALFENADVLAPETKTRHALLQFPVGTVEPHGVIALHFKLNDACKASIAAACAAHTACADNLEQVALTLPFGKEDCKRRFKIGPDALCQAAYHLAYARSHGTMAAAYESCSTGKFFHGRTETIRSASPHMNDFVRAALGARRSSAAAASSSSGGGGDENLSALLRVAAETHKQLGTEAANGEGVDRHLLALKSLVKEFADPAGLAFYSEPLYGISGTWSLSTSNISQPGVAWFCFGPVTPTGYGVGYCVHDDAVHVGLAAFRDGGDGTSAAAMSQHIAEAAADIVRYLGGGKKKSS